MYLLFVNVVYQGYLCSMCKSWTHTLTACTYTLTWFCTSTYRAQRRWHRNEQDREHRQDQSIGEWCLCSLSSRYMYFGYNWYTNCIFASWSAHQSPKDQYLYGSGWATPGHELHKQPWEEAAMDNFHAKQRKWEHQLCIVCHELWLTRACSRDRESTYQCTRCTANVIRESPNCIH